MGTSWSLALRWGIWFCCLSGLLGALSVEAQQVLPDAAGPLPDDASPTTGWSKGTDQVPDATTRQRLIGRIEQEQAKLHKVQADLERVEKERARKQRELESARRKERQLKGDLDLINSRRRIGRRAGIGWNERNIETYKYNLEVRFPRERRKMLALQDTILAEREEVDRLLSALFRGSLAWPLERTSPTSHQAILSRAVLQRTLPRLMEQKARHREELQEIAAEIRRIDEDIELDKYLIRGNIRGKERKEKERAPLARNLEETARRRRQAEEEIEESQGRIEALQALIAQMQETLPLLQKGIDYKSFPEQKGTLFWPIAGRVLHPFGPRKHAEFDLVIDNPGIDIVAAAGDEIRAVAGGWVVYTGTLPGYGSLVMLHHGSGFFSCYASAVPVEEAPAQDGADVRVEPGQVIARVAVSPPAVEGVLHFEIRQGERALNPLDWLRRREVKTAGDPSGVSKE